ncbi:MAG: 2,3-bisphosphoglycerate-independent phosphoglycerate mutase [Elusimicrobiota bacterium]|nr:2,3-bisphosphoglycerate-independent phosphoglycerate mutase [Elusimicrobiota bacterium]
MNKEKFELMKSLVQKNDAKILFFVMDGLGGLPHPDFEDKTELEIAKHPNLDRLIKKGICGLTDPVFPGITPGSGPAHLSLFGYNPMEHQIGRGLLDTLGIDFDFTQNDMAARGNFATIDENGIITDRRAGRISTQKNEEICKLLSNIKISGVEIFLKTVKEHRFSVIFRSPSLNDEIEDTDPQKEGLKPLPAIAKTEKAKSAAELVNKFIAEAEKILKNHYPVNSLLLRGFSKMIKLEKYQEVFQLNPASIAVYPMYRGLTKLLGMNVLDAGQSIKDEFDCLKKNYSNYDYFFMHIKKTDTYGEDGNFEEKVKIIEEFDEQFERVFALNPDVIVITGDHSTPALMKGHSWHSVPSIIYSKVCRHDSVETFNEKECLKGGIGRISAQYLMSLAMANAGKLKKFGA